MAKGGLKDVILGLGIGVCLGALLTPKNGEENRKAVKAKATELVDKAKKIDYEALKEKLYDEFYTLKDEVADMESEKALAIAKSTAESLEAKADKLIADAIEAGKPKVEKSVVELKKKTAELLKDISKKLEA